MTNGVTKLDAEFSKNIVKTGNDLGCYMYIGDSSGIVKILDLGDVI